MRAVVSVLVLRPSLGLSLGLEAMSLGPSLGIDALSLVLDLGLERLSLESKSI